jgi:hypothetical protein
MLSDDSIGSGPRPEPNSLQDPLTSYPQAEPVEQAVEQIRQDHMYIASPKSSSQAGSRSTGRNDCQSGSGSKRKTEDSAVKAVKKR